MNPQIIILIILSSIGWTVSAYFYWKYLHEKVEKERLKTALRLEKEGYKIKTFTIKNSN